MDKLEYLLGINSINLSEFQIKVIKIYINELLRKNREINLISRKDEEKIIERHIIPCLKFSTLFENFDQKCLDIGTGGGLPGIPFAIVNPKSHITLIDSTAKKVKAVESILQKFELNNVELIWTRAEDKNFIKNYGKKFNLIISRATSDLKTLIEYSNPLLIDSNSKLAVMKGGKELDEEIESVKKRFNYIAIQKVPLIYLPENFNNINQKFAVIVERIHGIK